MSAPSFKGLTPSSAASSRAKRANRARDTSPELALRRALWGLGVRYRIHATDLPGRPDIVLRKARVAVFCDGDFWHGRGWRALRLALQRRANASYWIAKIKSNRLRDARSRRALRRLGWHVIALWETDIKRDPEQAARVIKTAVEARLVQAKPGQRRAPPRKGSAA